MKKLKHYFAITLGSFLLLFAIQNLTTIEINFLFWSFQTHRFLIIGFSVITGIFIGLVIGTNKKTDQIQSTKES